MLAYRGSYLAVDPAVLDGRFATDSMRHLHRQVGLGGSQRARLPGTPDLEPGQAYHLQPPSFRQEDEYDQNLL